MTNRVPKGVPTGGQFVEGRSPEPTTTSLDADADTGISIDDARTMLEREWEARPGTRAQASDERVSEELDDYLRALPSYSRYARDRDTHPARFKEARTMISLHTINHPPHTPQT